MKIIVQIAELRDALAISLAKRGTLPVLEHVLLEVRENGCLSVTTSDFAQQLTFFVAAQRIDARGVSVAARADLLKAALYALSGEIELSVVDKRLVLQQGRRRFNIPALPGADFPVLNLSERKPVEVDPKHLAIALRRVAYCADKHNPRDYLNGVLVDGRRVAATDGNRMALAPLDCAGLPRAGILIPTESVKLLADCLLRDADAMVSLVSDEFLCVRGGGLELITKLASAVAPDYAAIVREAHDADVVACLDAREMADALKRLHGFCHMDGSTAKPFYRMRLSIGAGAVTLADPHDAATADTLEATAAERPDPVLLNPVYLADTLACVDGAARCEWRHVDALSVQCFRFDERTDEHYIMPMRV